MKLTETIGEYGLMAGPYGSSELVVRGLDSVSSAFKKYQEHKTGRKAILAVKEMTVEGLRTSLEKSLALIRLGGESRRASLETLERLLYGKMECSTEEIEMVLSFLLQIALSGVDMEPLPGIERPLEFILSRITSGQIGMEGDGCELLE